MLDFGLKINMILRVIVIGKLLYDCVWDLKEIVKLLICGENIFVGFFYLFELCRVVLFCWKVDFCLLFKFCF